MYTPDLRQFSTKLKVPWKILYHQSEHMRRVFENILKGYIPKKPLKTSVRVFPHALTCKMIVRFEDKQRNPDAIDALIDKVARRALLNVIAEHNE